MMMELDGVPGIPDISSSSSSTVIFVRAGITTMRY
jgi:hypothetical protein